LLLFTQYKTTARGLPLSAATVSLHYLLRQWFPTGVPFTMPRGAAS